jgi:hypothetical protein
LEVNVPIGRHTVDQVADMLVEVAQVLILRANELLAEQFPRAPPCGTLLGENSIAQQRRKDARTTAEPVVLETGREERLYVGWVQDVVCTRSDEQILTQVVPRLVVLGDGAEEGEETAVRVGLPELFDAVNPQRPSLGQFRR